jgi:hypothetical protein
VIRYVFGSDHREPYLEYYATHRTFDELDERMDEIDRLLGEST